MNTSRLLRRDFVSALESIREDVKKVARDFGFTHMSDATSMELERLEKTAKLFDGLIGRLYEDIAIIERVTADRVKAGLYEQADLFTPPPPEEPPKECAAQVTPCKKVRKPKKEEVK